MIPILFLYGWEGSQVRLKHDFRKIVAGGPAKAHLLLRSNNDTSRNVPYGNFNCTIEKQKLGQIMTFSSKQTNHLVTSQKTLLCCCVRHMA